MADITMKVLAEVCKAFPPNQSILVRGPHGIGKSALAHELGRVFDCAVIDLRLSQMTEGDFLGLPKLSDNIYNDKDEIIKQGQTEFMPPDWFVKAMTQPVILLLDEINRATPELMQCGFQLIYDRMIQGKALHPGTRIIACVNASHHYQVNEMDPALLNRFWTCDLVPQLKDWLSWARKEGNIDSSIIEFCSQNKTHWWHNPKEGLNPGTIYPTPRGWDMLNRALTLENSKGGTLFDNPKTPVFRHMANGLVGDEAGAAFYDFIINYDRHISAEQILDHYKKDVQKKVKAGMTAEALSTINEKLLQHCSEKQWTKRQAKNIALYMKEMDNKELAFAFWTGLTMIKDNDKAETNMRLIHKEARDIVLEAMGQSLGTS